MRHGTSVKPSHEVSSPPWDSTYSEAFALGLANAAVIVRKARTSSGLPPENETRRNVLAWWMPTRTV